jgi:hypothetical protein
MSRYLHNRLNKLENAAPSSSPLRMPECFWDWLCSPQPEKFPERDRASIATCLQADAQVANAVRELKPGAVAYRRRLEKEGLPQPALLPPGLDLIEEHCRELLAALPGSDS